MSSFEAVASGKGTSGGEDPNRIPMMIAFGMLDRMDVVLAERIGLTACDAGYLWLARRMSAELATLDRQLEAARAMD